MSRLCANCDQRPRDGKHRLCARCRRRIQRCEPAALDFCLQCHRDTPRSWLDDAGVCRPCRRLNNHQAGLIRDAVPQPSPNVIVFGSGEVRVECDGLASSNLSNLIFEPIRDIRKAMALHKNHIRRIEFR